MPKLQNLGYVHSDNEIILVFANNSGPTAWKCFTQCNYSLTLKITGLKPKLSIFRCVLNKDHWKSCQCTTVCQKCIHLPQATLASGSTFKWASKIASLTWSQSLSTITTHHQQQTTWWKYYDRKKLRPTCSQL